EISVVCDDEEILPPGSAIGRRARGRNGEAVGGGRRFGRVLGPDEARAEGDDQRHHQRGGDGRRRWRPPWRAFRFLLIGYPRRAARGGEGSAAYQILLGSLLGRCRWRCPRRQFMELTRAGHRLAKRAI